MIITIGFDDQEIGTLDEKLEATGNAQAIYSLATPFVAKGLEGKDLLEAIVDASNGRFWAEKAKRPKEDASKDGDEKPDQQAADEQHDSPPADSPGSVE